MIRAASSRDFDALASFDNATIICKRPRLASHRWRAPLKTKPPAEYVRWRLCLGTGRGQLPGGSIDSSTSR